MSQAKTALIKYIFLDIVGFTKKRSVEAQSDLIGYLNALVTQSLENNNLDDYQAPIPRNSGRYILIPTGDGVCIALVDAHEPFDIHLNVALDILSLVDDHNNKTQEEMRKFEVRIGVNENVDNLVKDINGNQNVAGNGINTAQRTMNQADNGQILVGQTTYETLCGREKYMKHFRKYMAKAKHGIQFPVYQYIAKGKRGLNIEIPEVFVSVSKVEPKLSRLAAYYLAHSIKNEKFLLTRKMDNLFEYAASILLYFLAYDSVLKSQTTKYGDFRPITWSSNTANFEQKYNHYKEGEFWVIEKLAECIKDLYLNNYSFCFESSPCVPLMFIFVSNEGKLKLKKEWHEIWEEFSLDEFQ